MYYDVLCIINPVLHESAVFRVHADAFRIDRRDVIVNGGGGGGGGRGADDPEDEAVRAACRAQARGRGRRPVAGRRRARPEPGARRGRHVGGHPGAQQAADRHENGAQLDGHDAEAGEHVQQLLEHEV